MARAISSLLARRGHGYDHVVATKDYHVDPGATSRTRRTTRTPGRRTAWPGLAGSDFHPDLATGPIEAVFRKGAHAAAYSGFEGAADDGTPLAAWLRAHGVDRVDVVGIATDYCVRATAADAAANGFAPGCCSS